MQFVEYRKTSEQVPDSFKTKCSLFSIKKQAHFNDCSRVQKTEAYPGLLNIR